MKYKFRKDVSIGGGQRKTIRANTQEELDRKVRGILGQVESGFTPGKDTERMDVVFQEWLESLKTAGEIAESTLLSYHVTVGTQLSPRFGRLRIKDMDRRCIQYHFDEMQISRNTAKRALSIIRMVMRYAESRGYIYGDPTEKVKLRQQDSEKSGMTCLDVDQVRRMLKMCPHVTQGNLFGLLVLTGLRCGEAIVLRRKDFAEDFSFVRVSRTITDSLDKRSIIKDGTKTKAGQRTVPLPEPAREFMRSQDELRQKKKRTGHELWFGNRNGNPLDRSYLIRQPFRRLKALADLPDQMVIHDLRHTYATTTLNAGIGVHVVSKLLGHSKVAVTLDVYSHALPPQMFDAADRLTDLFS